MRPLRSFVFLIAVLVAAPFAQPLFSDASAHPPIPWGHDPEETDAEPDGADDTDDTAPDEGPSDAQSNETADTGSDEEATDPPSSSENATEPSAHGHDSANTSDEAESAELPPFDNLRIETHVFEGTMRCGASLWVVRTVDKCNDHRASVTIHPGLVRAEAQITVGDAFIGDAGICVIAVMPYYERVCGGQDTEGTMYQATPETYMLWTQDANLPLRIKLDDDEIVSIDQPYEVTLTFTYAE